MHTFSLMYYRNVISYSDTSKNDESSFVVPPFTFERHQGFHTDFAKHGNFYFSSPLPKLHLLLLLSDKIYIPLNNTSREKSLGRRAAIRTPRPFSKTYPFFVRVKVRSDNTKISEEKILLLCRCLDNLISLT